MLTERIKEIYEELNQFEDPFMRYSFLAEFSAYVSPHQPELMQDANLYQGCQSRVWITYEIKNGTFEMNATSDTLLIRGILYVMMNLYNGLTPEEISRHKINFLKECGVEEHFSSDRIAGIGGLSESVYQYCLRYCQEADNFRFPDKISTPTQTS